MRLQRHLRHSVPCAGDLGYPRGGKDLPGLQRPAHQDLCPQLSRDCCQLLELGPLHLQRGLQLRRDDKRPCLVRERRRGAGRVSLDSWRRWHRHCCRLPAGRDCGRPAPPPGGHRCEPWGSCLCASTRTPPLLGWWLRQLHGAVRAGLHAGCLVSGLHWDRHHRGSEGFLPTKRNGPLVPVDAVGMRYGYRCCSLRLRKNRSFPCPCHYPLSQRPQSAGAVRSGRKRHSCRRSRARCHWERLLHRLRQGHLHR
mmetsp:Transcript_22975/g.53760  ORF Transcript_22975/g.53760 Transcript_22975/m.53760 type:complete len:253 (+) Transcript_22975:1010-1768(+)